LDIQEATSLKAISPEKKLPEKKVFQGRYFTSDIEEHILTRLSHGQRVAGDFDFPVGVPLFFFAEGKVQYVLKYDGKILRSLKKIF